MNNRDGPSQQWRGELEARRDYVDAKLEGIARELQTLERLTDSRFRDAEVTRNLGIDRVALAHREGITSFEGRMTEKFNERDRALEKAASVIDEKFAQIYIFRDQISGERLSYVTRDTLADTLKGIIAEIDLIKRAIALSAGRENGISKTWAGILIAFSILSALSAAAAAVAKFTH
jgi:hypothetical protein